MSVFVFLVDRSGIIRAGKIERERNHRALDDVQVSEVQKDRIIDKS